MKNKENKNTKQETQNKKLRTRLLAGIISFFAKLFKSEDLTLEAWERLESRMTYRDHERNCMQMRFYV